MFADSNELVRLFIEETKTTNPRYPMADLRDAYLGPTVGNLTDYSSSAYNNSGRGPGRDIAGGCCQWSGTGAKPCSQWTISRSKSLLGRPVRPRHGPLRKTAKAKIGTEYFRKWGNGLLIQVLNT
jgi:hypothetical protein